MNPGKVGFIYDKYIGFEFVGRRTDTGERVMGGLAQRGVASHVFVAERDICKIPETWTMEEAATIKVVLFNSTLRTD